jgi:formamidopyrimidine-DNA glycosylase
MPELPEVQTIVSDLEVIVAKKIFDIRVFWDKTVDNISVHSLVKKVKNKTIEKVSRRAKYIIIELDSGAYLVFHLRMSGQLIFLEKDNLKYKHIRLEISFDDSSKLIFNEMRKFGRTYYFDRSSDLNSFFSNRVGKEPLEISDEEFIKLLESRGGIIKAALLRQDLICGLGNIYVDESLYLAGILPTNLCRDLSQDKLKKLNNVIKTVLKKAIGLRGTSMRDYLDVTGNAGKYKEILNVYGRQGKECRKCHSKIKKSESALEELIFARGVKPDIVF